MPSASLPLCHHLTMLCKLGLNTRAPYHVLIYSLIFGASTFHSFVLSPVAFKTLKREDFGLLQSKIFPSYFVAQATVPLLLGATAPFKLCPFGIGLLTASAVAGALNYLVFLPLCERIKNERNAAQKDDSSTEAVAQLNRKFGQAHALLSIANLVSIVSLGVYGVYLTRGLVKL